MAKGRVRALVWAAIVWAVVGAHGAGEYDRWDRLFIKPQVPLPVLAGRGELAVLVYHRYPMALHRLRLAAAGEAVVVEGAPPVIPELLPTTVETVRLPLRTVGRPEGDTAPLALVLSCDEMSRPCQVTLDLPLTAAAAQRLNDAAGLPVGGIMVKVTSTSRLTEVLQTTVVVLLLLWVWWRQRRVAVPG